MGLVCSSAEAAVSGTRSSDESTIGTEFACRLPLSLTRSERQFSMAAAKPGEDNLAAAMRWRRMGMRENRAGTFIAVSDGEENFS